MGDPRGFLTVPRSKSKVLPVVERLKNYHEFVVEPASEALKAQASRCMDCGIPFCHQGCPLGNLIPEFNDLVYQGRDDEARERLLATNDFPEMTGRICPAPCEASCVLNLRGEPVTIKDVERHLALTYDAAPLARAAETGKRVAVVGSGPAGLAAARNIALAGHAVTVFERDDRIGGLLRYGIPDFKLEKELIDRRQRQLEAEGVAFRVGVALGKDVELEALAADYDAVVLALGARVPRPLGLSTTVSGASVDGASLGGVHYAMDFLEAQNREVAGDRPNSCNVHGKHVVVLGGGDTGADCVGTSNRQGAASVTQLELLPEPPKERGASDLWPAWPMTLRTSTSHDEGCTRTFAVRTTRLLADATGTRLAGLELVHVEYTDGRLTDVPESTFTLPADHLFVATGFVAVALRETLEKAGVSVDGRGRVVADPETGETTRNNVYVAGDASRGASLVVWALADGRRVAAAVNARLGA
jgi:glutamate synthase (NADPH/NADH) small chain